jgi:hypothetical protein
VTPDDGVVQWTAGRPPPAKECRDCRSVLDQSANGCPLGIPDWRVALVRGWGILGPIGPMVLGA